jgi:lysophospholipase L1-like esterase
VLTAPSHTDRHGTVRSYVRFAALGDSATFGVGDHVRRDECRGWARLLVDAMGREHDVSFCNLASPGAVAADVRRDQLATALAHRPHLASLIVGFNDTLRPDWDPGAVARDLEHCARRLTEQGALLMTARFHDHTRVFRLPRFAARPLQRRIAALNDTYDDLHRRFGGIVVDLGAHPGIYEREFWSLDRLHPSELGHRALADEAAAQLHAHGLTFDPPGLRLDGRRPTRANGLRTLVTEVAPWVGRRVREYAPAVLSAARGR